MHAQDALRKFEIWRFPTSSQSRLLKDYRRDPARVLANFQDD